MSTTSPSRSSTGSVLAAAAADRTTDVRFMQVPFAALLVVEAVLRVAGGAIDPEVPQALAGIAAVGLAVAVCLVPTEEMSGLAVVALCATDLSLVGLSRLAPEDGGAGLLVVLPAIWIGGVLGRAGAALTGVLVVALVGAPGAFYGSFDGETLSRTLPLPLVAAAVSYAVAVTQGNARRARGQSRAHLEALEEAVTGAQLESSRIQAILDTAGVGLVLFDPDGSMAYVNPLALPTLQLAFPGSGSPLDDVGYTFEEDGTTLVPRAARPAARIARGEEFDDFRMWIGPEPATRRLISFYGRQVRTDDGTAAGGVVAQHDITTRERDRRLRDSFLDTIAHELRTPITALDGHLYLLDGVPDLPEEAIELLPGLHRATQRLAGLSAQLVNELQAHSAPLSTVEVDLGRLVSDACDTRRAAAAEAGVALVLHRGRSLVGRVDGARMAQAVGALLDRALESAPPGSTVRVSVAGSLDTLEIAVSDEGPGIDSSQHFAVLAEPELATAQSAVNGHRGRLEIDSSLGSGGVTFLVRLPRRAG